MRTLLELELPREPACGGIARRAIEERAQGELPPEMLDDLKLLVTELVDNAYVHGEGRMWLKLEHGDRRLRVEVVDEGEGASVQVRPSPTPSGGYGLRIVEQLAERWGAHEGTTHVWAELRLPEA
jgi:anti-sigma regulatory factor (Ser/Thr protein kinase)